jgi:cathepsin E
MHPIASLTTFFFLIVSVATNPIIGRKSPVSLSLARHFDITGGHNLVKQDQARAKSLVSIGKAKQSGVFSRDSIASVSVATGVTIEISIGSPPSFCG